MDKVIIGIAIICVIYLFYNLIIIRIKEGFCCITIDIEQFQMHLLIQ